MSNCKDCGQEIQWIDGKPYDLEPCLHFRSCKAKKKAKRKPARVRKDAELKSLLVNGHAPRPREGGASEEDWAKFQKLLEEQG